MLVKISLYDINAELDLRYATANNICGRPLYRENADLWLHEDAMKMLEEAGGHALAKGFTLLVFDGYRPKRVQEALWVRCPDERYVANPGNGGSLHTRGIAVDLTLVSLDEPLWLPVNMGTDFDEMSEAAHWGAYHRGLITPEQHGMREKLLEIMEEAGFETIETEWWHYQLPLKGNEVRYSLIEEHEVTPLTHPDLLAEVA